MKIVAAWVLIATPSWATQGSLFQGGGSAPLVDLGQSGAALIQAGTVISTQTPSPSLFTGRNQGSLFQPPPQRQSTPNRFAVLKSQGVVGLRQLIASAEAGSADYDAVQHGARIKPPKRPTQMTIAEINWWIKATPGQPHAIGRYQFIPATLRRLVKELGVDDGRQFTPEVQDLLADELFREAGFLRFQRGELSRTGFMNNLAKIWAGLPTSEGKSYYHGYAGNYATLPWAQYEAEMKRIFPANN